jgi:hypothetical protein
VNPGRGRPGSREGPAFSKEGADLRSEHREMETGRPRPVFSDPMITLVIEQTKAAHRRSRLIE